MLKLVYNALFISQIRTCFLFSGVLPYYTYLVVSTHQKNYRYVLKKNTASGRRYSVYNPTQPTTRSGSSYVLNTGDTAATIVNTDRDNLTSFLVTRALPLRTRSTAQLLCLQEDKRERRKGGQFGRNVGQRSGKYVTMVSSNNGSRTGCI